MLIKINVKTLIKGCFYKITLPKYWFTNVHLYRSSPLSNSLISQQIIFFILHMGIIIPQFLAH